MKYTQDKALFLKVVDVICDDVLRGVYAADDRVPSVRDLAGVFEINYNTVLRAMEVLQRDEIVYQKRGIGYFIAPQARRRILYARKQSFMKSQLPEFFRQARLLGIGIDEIADAWASTPPADDEQTTAPA